MVNNGLLLIINSLAKTGIEAAVADDREVEPVLLWLPV